MVLATSIFAVQDAISRYLASEYNVIMIVMVRYWFFAFFVILLVLKTQGGIQKAFHTSQPFLQFFRGTLLALEVCVIVLAFMLGDGTKGRNQYGDNPLNKSKRKKK